MKREAGLILIIHPKSQPRGGLHYHLDWAIILSVEFINKESNYYQYKSLEETIVCILLSKEIFP